MSRRFAGVIQVFIRGNYTLSIHVQSFVKGSRKPLEIGVGKVISSTGRTAQLMDLAFCVHV
jgi:hypothetical protein